eukprot:symbB.v1.2.021071.t1/scaffold1801.1/size100802/4
MLELKPCTEKKGTQVLQGSLESSDSLKLQGPRAFGETLHGYFAANDSAENHLFVSHLMLLYFSGEIPARAIEGRGLCQILHGAAACCHGGLWHGETLEDQQYP